MGVPQWDPHCIRNPNTRVFGLKKFSKNSDEWGAQKSAERQTEADLRRRIAWTFKAKLAKWRAITFHDRLRNHSYRPRLCSRPCHQHVCTPGVGADEGAGCRGCTTAPAGDSARLFNLMRPFEKRHEFRFQSNR